MCSEPGPLARDSDTDPALVVPEDGTKRALGQHSNYRGRVAIAESPCWKMLRQKGALFTK
jgi:hypothetical protein